MNKNNVVSLSGRESVSDTVADLLKTGVQQLLQQPIEAELQQFMQPFEDRRLEDSRAAVVRNGHQPERALQFGIGPVTIKVPKVRDRNGEPVTFRSALVPPLRAQDQIVGSGIALALPQRRIHGEMGDALEVLVAPEAKGLSASTVARLKQQWADEYDAWRNAGSDEIQHDFALVKS